MSRKSVFPVDGPLTFGLDIGIASVGWAVLQMETETEPDVWQGIVGLGVRIFDRAEDGKTGEPLNLARRIARSTRRRLARRVKRLHRLRQALSHAGVVPGTDMTYFNTPAQATDPWVLRAEALDRCLTSQEWARVLYHLVKHRGFYVARKSEESDDASSEGGKMTAGVQRTQALCQQKGYRSIGEMVAQDAEFANAKRNKAGEYKNSFYRKLLRQELALLFERQQVLGNPHAGQDLYQQVDDIFWAQKPALSGEALLRMLGHCTFEKDQYRAAKSTWTAERFVWLTRLNNLRISENGERRPLNAAEREVVLNLPYTKKMAVTYADIRKMLDKALGFEAAATFAKLDYAKKGDKAEAEKLFEAKAFHALRKIYEKHQLGSLWQKRQLDHAWLDNVGTDLSVYKTDDELREKLAQHGGEPAEINALLEVPFSGFINLSLKALHKILPYVEQGQRYDEACAQAGYCHSVPTSGQKYHKLPPLDEADIRNPVVFRALNQARKVLNALIDKYGSPYAVHVELSRDLSHSLKERQNIEKDQKGYADHNEQLRQAFRENFGVEPKGKDLLKYRLYKEQHGKSAYSQSTIDLTRLLEHGYLEIDHILPYSRSFDNTFNNKVLVLDKENREKCHQTPYEYLDGAADSYDWHRFTEWVKSNPSFRTAKRDRLLRKHFDEKDEKGFVDRNLNDTRYATRYFAELLREQLRFRDPTNPAPVLTPSGGFTGFLRARWGLIKVREESDLHHALDACVVAAASHALIKRVSDYHRIREEYELMRGGTFIDRETGKKRGQISVDFPLPWPHFRQEVLARLAPDAPECVSSLSHYDAARAATVVPIWVSRAPKRRNGGAWHKETIQSAKYLAEGKSTKRLPLKDLKISYFQPLKDSGKPNDEILVGLEDPRNAGLVNVLRQRLAAFDGNAAKAFAEPVYKPLVDGSPGPLIRTVKVFTTLKGGVPVRGGMAEQSTMWRVDVFHKAGKYYLVPIYQSDRRKGGELPNQAATAGKNREAWEVMDETYDFCFSLCLNDMVKLKTRKEAYLGYFAGLDVSTGAINILSHDRNRNAGKEGLYRGLGVKTGVVLFEKWNVDVLGNLYLSAPQQRQMLR